MSTVTTTLEEIKGSNAVLIGCGLIGLMLAFIVAMAIGAGVVWYMLRQPTPGPTPTPTPTPAPVNTLSDDLKRALADDGGAETDAAQLSAIFTQFGDTLTYDGLQTAPTIKSIGDLGKSFARLQRYRYLATDTPLGTRFPRVEARIASEIKTRGLDTPGPLDARREPAARLFHEVGAAFK